MRRTTGDDDPVDHEVSLTEVTNRPTVVVAATTTWQDFPALWGQLLGEVWDCLRAGGVHRGCRDVMLYQPPGVSQETIRRRTSARWPTCIRTARMWTRSKDAVTPGAAQSSGDGATMLESTDRQRIQPVLQQLQPPVPSSAVWGKA